MAQEIATFGIHSLTVEPGMLRTDFLDASSARFGDLEIADYAEAAAQFRSVHCTGANHAQPNDPAVLAAHITRLVGDAAPPSRFIFGGDALAWIGDKVTALKGDLTRSAEIASGAAA